MRTSIFEINGEKHLLCFNLWAIAECMERFGGLTEMHDAMTKGSVKENLDASIWVMEILQRGGEMYAEEMGVKNAEPLSAKRMLSICGADFFASLKNIVIGAINSSMSTNVKVEDSKNVETTQAE